MYRTAVPCHSFASLTQSPLVAQYGSLPGATAICDSAIGRDPAEESGRTNGDGRARPVRWSQRLRIIVCRVSHMAFSFKLRARIL